VLIGYDINKCVWEVDEEHKEIGYRIFPPEIHSVDCDFNYYYFEDDLFNGSKKRPAKIQTLAK
jgi:hypothetical protein